MKRPWLAMLAVLAAIGCRNSQPSANPFLRTTVPPPATGQGAVVVPGEQYYGTGVPPTLQCAAQPASLHRAAARLCRTAAGVRRPPPVVTTQPGVAPAVPAAPPIVTPAPMVAPPPPPVVIPPKDKFSPPGGSFQYNQS